MTKWSSVLSREQMGGEEEKSGHKDLPHKGSPDASLHHHPHLPMPAPPLGVPRRRAGGQGREVAQLPESHGLLPLLIKQ